MVKRQKCIEYIIPPPFPKRKKLFGHNDPELMGTQAALGYPGCPRSIDDILSAKEEGMRWKLLASAEMQSDGEVIASVKPKKIPLNHPLANVMNATNSITFSTKYLGDITITGPGAGMMPTGYAIFNDILDIFRNLA